jgi:uroporphyrin-3 C-methyltransferase
MTETRQPGELGDSEPTAAPSADTTEAEAAETAADIDADAERTAASEDAVEAPSQRGGVSRLLLVTAFALCFAVLAATAAGFLWWQYRQFYVSLDEADAGMNAALQDVRANLRAQRDRLDDHDDALADALAEDRATLAELDRRLDAVPGRFSSLEQRIDAVQGGSFDARAEWLRAEAEYYLALANTELALAGRWDSATEALELADDKLRELANPRFNAARSAIAAELQALRAVRRPDIDGLAFSLGRLSERAASLPLRAAAPENFAQGRAALGDAEPGLGRLWLGLKTALSGIIRVERRDATPAAALNSAEQRLARRQLELELELARLAALRGEPAGFATSLAAARQMLERDFDASADAVVGALALLDELAQFDVAPERPDISGSLNALRNASLGGD